MSFFRLFFFFVCRSHSIPTIDLPGWCSSLCITKICILIFFLCKCPNFKLCFLIIDLRRTS
ncbi:hypothetical protein ABFS82_12G047000 [Erythranthe guttata]